MLPIFLSWCYIFFTLTNFGFAAVQLLGFTFHNRFLQLVLGLLFILVLSHIWAFFGGFGILFHSTLFVVNLVIAFIFRKSWIQFIQAIQHSLYSLRTPYQILLCIVSILILAKSASQGSLIDNENYYIQTIKWLSEYGFVTGLANFNMLLAQSSGWHVLQAVFSFPFVDLPFNDFGGFVLLVINGYAFILVNGYTPSKSIFIWLPVFNWFLLELSVVPSPDFGILFFSVLIISIFIKSYSNPSKQEVQLAILFFAGAMLIKITALGLILIPLVLWYRCKSKSALFHLQNGLIALIFIFLLISKNLVISGYPLYPSDALSSYFSSSHQIPEALYRASLAKEKLLEFFAKTEQVNQLSTLGLIWKWFTYSKISMLCNGFLFILVFAVPFYIIRFNSKPVFWWIYASFIVQLVFLASTSPQYRFVIHYFILFALVLLAYAKLTSKYNLILLYSSQILVFFLLFYPIDYGLYSSKTYSLQSRTFQYKNWITPAPNTSMDTKYTTQTIGNLSFQTPLHSPYLWSSGDGDLPCINQKQLVNSAKKTHYIPQLIDSLKLSKGFYSVKID